MKSLTLWVLCVLVVVGCADEDPARHLADAPGVDSAADVALHVEKAGNGTGSITSSPAGLSCGATCEAKFPYNATVTLTATPETGSLFTGWSGACSGTATTCEVTLAAAASVTATFTVETHTVTVTKAGPGMGLVMGHGMSCGDTCSIVVDHGTVLSLTASPQNLSVFAGWGGACTGNATCNLTVTADVAVTANFALDNFSLFVEKSGTGDGTVTSSPAGINCGAACLHTFTANEMVTLTATPATGSSFSSWDAANCSGTGPCTVTMTQAKTITATFTLNKYALDVAKTGNGAGTVTATGIDCGTDCTEDYDYGATVTLTAAPGTGSVFGGWSGACTGSGTCTVTIDGVKDVTARFTLQTFVLDVATVGSGTVTGTGINCGADCTEVYNYATPVTLTATPATGYSFTGWSGACSGTGTCALSMTAGRSVTATFTINKYALTITPPTNGTITGSGIDCGTDCTETFDHGTNVTLTATPATGYSFTGWTGACSGTGACTVAMTSAKTVGATFTINKYTLTVTPPTNGTITASGINCGTDCTENYDYNTVVAMTATPATGYSFTGWTGACSGTGACNVTMTAARTVGATFAINSYALTVTPPTNGTITGSGIDCGTDCSQTFTHGTSVTLTATPATGYSFTGWTGACSGTGACTVVMTSAKTVGATFAINNYLLTVSTVGNGTVAGTGITCGTDCTEAFPYNTNVMLTAAPATGYSFTGWSGACTGTGTCTVSMTQARSVTATFSINNYTLTVTPPVNGTVTGSGITCGNDCSEPFVYNTSVMLTATPATGYSFTGWTGACSGTGACTVLMTQAQTVGATFAVNNYVLTITPPSHGSITGSGINCGTDCSESYVYNTNVTLTPVPQQGYEFKGWTGACSGTGSCVVPMTQAQTVGATFAITNWTLTVAKSGSGTVAGTGITCGTDCTETFPYGTSVTLTATPATGWQFTGWSDPSCPGTGTCTLSMTQTRDVTATFVQVFHQLKVNKLGDGFGTVYTSDNTIDCGTDCTESYAEGTMVTLKAKPVGSLAQLSTFTGWSGPCTGTGDCTVTVNDAVTVTATFTLEANKFFVTKEVFTGSLGGLAGADAKCKAAAQAVNLPGTYVAYISSIEGNTPITAPSRLGNAKGWERMDGKPLMRTPDQMHLGTLFSTPSITETKEDIANSNMPYVWTGTTNQGTYHSACSAAVAFIPWGGTFGSAMMGISSFTTYQAVQGDTFNCGQLIHLYCFGIDRAKDLP